MKTLTILQELQTLAPQTKNYTIYEVQQTDHIIKIAIPTECCVEFDSILEEGKWDSLDSLLRTYNGFVVNK